MHDYTLSVVNDHIDEKIKSEIEIFYAKTHNRHTPQLSPFPVVKTLMDNKSLANIENIEHHFSAEKIQLNNYIKSCPTLRRSSAIKFCRYSELKQDIFEGIIYASYGAKMHNGKFIFPYPSGGALYSGQVVIYIKNVEGFQVGAYHYLPKTNQLEKLSNLNEEVINKSLFIKSDARFNNYDFFVFYGSLLDKHVCKYGYRGIRLAILEIGSMYRNIEIESAKYSLNSRVWGGFRDESLAISLGLDPRVIVPVICQLVGRE
ncbi:TPA: SagB/ThcOx family dehydrogenase [Salmonella enterica subsp. salamae serovar 56:l,v:z39]|nr:SagB/ThcOx family dehydrogenase [Salmonella enterica subsp. salamae serovar 56:l,v:z39]